MYRLIISNIANYKKS